MHEADKKVMERLVYQYGPREVCRALADEIQALGFEGMEQAIRKAAA